MRRPITSALGLFFLACVSTTAHAEGWRFLPVTDTGFKHDFTLSAMVGSISPEHGGGTQARGLELAFNCILLQPPVGSFRTKLSLLESKHSGIELSTLEVNPRWTLNLDKNLTFGVGPGLGWVRSEYSGQRTTMMAGQVGADLNYRVAAVTFGLDVRRQQTRQSNIGGGLKGANNTVTALTVGYNF